jgi:oxalate decarboxylase
MMDFNANDSWLCSTVAGHYIENTGDTDLVFLEMFKADQYMDFSINNWIRHLPPEMVTSHLNIDEVTISYSAPQFSTRTHS